MPPAEPLCTVFVWACVSVHPQVKIGLITRRVNERQKMDLQINQHGSEPGRERERQEREGRLGRADKEERLNEVRREAAQEEGGLLSPVKSNLSETAVAWSGFAAKVLHGQNKQVGRKTSIKEREDEGGDQGGGFSSPYPGDTSVGRQLTPRLLLPHLLVFIKQILRRKKWEKHEWEEDEESKWCFKG